MDAEALATERENTPGIQSGVIHFNNAGASLPTTTVLNGTIDYLNLEANIGGYEAVTARFDDIKHRPHRAIASLLGCDEEEVAIVTSATTAWQQIIYGLAWSTFKPGNRLLTSENEYGSNYIAYLQLAKRTGIIIEVIPETEQGDVDLDVLEDIVVRNKDTAGSVVLISITHVPTSSGRIYDAAGVGKIATKHGILYMLDACQSVGQMPVNVKTIGCHFLTGTGRKYLRAPRGTGFLYCCKNVLEKNIFEPAAVDNTGASWYTANDYTLEKTAKRFEMYEMSMAARIGFSLAVEHCLNLGIEVVWQRIQHLANVLRRRLKTLQGVEILDHGCSLCGIVSFNKEGFSAEEVQEMLLRDKVNTSVSYAGSTRLDFEKRGLVAVVRASVHYYNSEEEIDVFIEKLKSTF